jgi:drug/metabolite transporter (DMT)-like permease
LAALLYIGGGAGALLFKFARAAISKKPKSEADITKKDIPWLAGMILAGGVAAPVILMYSLKATPAATASLLLNFEAVSTAIIAAIFFKEPLGKRVWAAVALITASAVLLTWNPAEEWGFSLGAAGIIGACILWGVDNNLTHKVSAKDPLTITGVKGIGAGAVSLILSFAAGSPFPSVTLVFPALLLGAFSYGFSIVLLIAAMRHLGAARASAFFGTAPFIGAVVSVILFAESPALQFYISIPIMIAGAVLISGEKHRHRHLHPYMEHDHKHRHDDLHHNHVHEDGFTGEHSHPHVHEAMEHDHAHLPDIHHRHQH